MARCIPQINAIAHGSGAGSYALLVWPQPGSLSLRHIGNTRKDQLRLSLGPFRLGCPITRDGFWAPAAPG